MRDSRKPLTCLNDTRTGTMGVMKETTESNRVALQQQVRAFMCCFFALFSSILH